MKLISVCDIIFEFGIYRYYILKYQNKTVQIEIKLSENGGNP